MNINEIKQNIFKGEINEQQFDDYFDYQNELNYLIDNNIDFNCKCSFTSKTIDANNPVVYLPGISENSDWNIDEILNNIFDDNSFNDTLSNFKNFIKTDKSLINSKIYLLNIEELKILKSSLSICYDTYYNILQQNVKKYSNNKLKLFDITEQNQIIENKNEIINQFIHFYDNIINEINIIINTQNPSEK